MLPNKNYVAQDSEH